MAQDKEDTKKDTRKDARKNRDGSDLSGRLLVSMPGMTDPRFEKSVIYMCGHSPEGAMGLVINRPMGALTFPELLRQLEISTDNLDDPIQVLFGGPVEQVRGFVLHSGDYLQDSSMVVDDGVALTATIDILKVIAKGGGPTNRLIALGYAGWGPGQLETELKGNGWLSVDADADLLFDTDLGEKWHKAVARLGIDPLMLSSDAGRA